MYQLVHVSLLPMNFITLASRALFRPKSHCATSSARRSSTPWGIRPGSPTSDNHMLCNNQKKQQPFIIYTLWLLVKWLRIVFYQKQTSIIFTLKIMQKEYFQLSFLFFFVLLVGVLTGTVTLSIRVSVNNKTSFAFLRASKFKYVFRIQLIDLSDSCPNSNLHLCFMNIWFNNICFLLQLR